MRRLNAAWNIFPEPASGQQVSGSAENLTGELMVNRLKTVNRLPVMDSSWFLFIRFLSVFWIEGKSDIKVSKISDCWLQRDSDLPFDFNFGSCGAYNDRVLMCFTLTQKEN